MDARSGQQAALPEKRPQVLPTIADNKDREKRSNRAATENGARWVLIGVTHDIVLTMVSKVRPSRFVRATQTASGVCRGGLSSAFALSYGESSLRSPKATAGQAS